MSKEIKSNKYNIHFETKYKPYETPNSVAELDAKLLKECQTKEFKARYQVYPRVLEVIYGNKT